MPRPLSDEHLAAFRERLLDAATRQFARHGLEGLTLRALAADLGVSPMTPYRYFKDKEAIVAALQARAFDRFARVLEQAFAASPQADARARAVGAAYARFAFAQPESYRLMFELPAPHTEAYPELQRASERARTMMTAYVRELVQAGILAGDPELLAHVFWSLVHGAVMLQLAKKFSDGFTYERVVAAGFAALFKGLAP